MKTKLGIVAGIGLALIGWANMQAGTVVNQYFPMNNGDSRYYQDHTTSYYTATEVFTQTNYNGHSVFALNFHDEWDGYPFAQDRWYLGLNGGALALYGISFGNMSFNSPANLLTDQSITNNQTITSQVTGLYAGSTFNITVRTTVSSIPGTVTVPLGTFNNCKLVLVAEVASYFGVTNFDSAAWVLAPGVGIVEDGVEIFDASSGLWSSTDYLELVSGTINGVPIDYRPPSNVLTFSWPANGEHLFLNPVSIWGTASDDGLGASGIAQVTVNGNRAFGDTAAGSGSAYWDANVYLLPGTNTLRIIATDGAGNSTTNFFTLVEMSPAPTLTTQPTNQTVAPGANVSFSVVAASSLPLSYQWRKDAAILNGATNSNYSIAGVLTNQAGNYSVVVTNASGSIVSSNALLFVDGQKPTVTITNPAINARLSNFVAQVSGTSSDNGRVTNVSYQLNSAGWNPANTGNNWSNWTAGINLTPGTNIVQAYAVDAAGNNSTTNSVSFVYVVTNRLSVATNGQDTVSPYPNNAWLEIGRRYTNTATAINGHKFANWIVATNWIGGVTNTNTAVAFLMQSNLTLTVNFTDTNKPTLTLTNPVANSRFAVPSKKVQGTAGDNVRVAGVYYQLNSNAWAKADTTNYYTNWASTVPFIKGTNTVKAYAVDLTGNYSATTSSVSFYCSNAFVMQLSATQTVASGGLGLNLTVSTGMTCRIDVSTNLLNWSTLTNFTSTNTTMQFRDTAATNNPKRFYRGVVP